MGEDAAGSYATLNAREANAPDQASTWLVYSCYIIYQIIWSCIVSDQPVAVITGGGTGIGAATAKELAKAGLTVVVTGRRPEPLEEVVSRIAEHGGTALARPGDVRDFDMLESLARELTDRFGQVDLLVPNAAVHDASLIAEGNPEWWHTVMDVNAVGLFNTVRAFLPFMLQRGAGHIIIVSSLSGRVTYVGETVYVASKHAQVAFADCLRQEVTPKGIRVTIVEPGLVETPFIDNPVGQELKKTVTPLDPEDCARAVRYIFEQPPNVVINEISMRPLKQLL
jgi:NADP-dependent 3-hydroxy acid dehydrogenase YdfG